jgi:hypothetical protein
LFVRESACVCARAHGGASHWGLLLQFRRLKAPRLL